MDGIWMDGRWMDGRWMDGRVDGGWKAERMDGRRMCSKGCKWQDGLQGLYCNFARLFLLHICFSFSQAHSCAWLSGIFFRPVWSFKDAVENNNLHLQLEIERIVGGWWVEWLRFSTFDSRPHDHNLARASSKKDLASNTLRGRSSILISYSHHIKKPTIIATNFSDFCNQWRFPICCFTCKLCTCPTNFEILWDT